MLGHLAAPRLTVTVRLAQWTSAVTMLCSFQYWSVWLFGFSGRVHLQLRGKEKKIPEERGQVFNSIFLAMTGRQALSEPALFLLCPLQIPEVGPTGWGPSAGLSTSQFFSQSLEKMGSNQHVGLGLNCAGNQLWHLMCTEWALVVSCLVSFS